MTETICKCAEIAAQATPIGKTVVLVLVAIIFFMVGIAYLTIGIKAYFWRKNVYNK